MTKKKEYKTASAFKRALEDRMAALSEKENLDISRLRRQLAFDRLLSRLFSDSSLPWALKGGYAMQLRLPNSRATRDVDLSLRDSRLFSNDPETQQKALGDLLRRLVEVPVNDFFSFVLTGPIMDLEGAPDGGYRFHVEVRLDSRSFEKFHLDIGIGDNWVEPLDSLKSRAWLDFMGIESQAFPAISKEQQFAEKIHAYTRPRVTPNSRVKDLIDMILFIQNMELDPKRLILAIQNTFKRRDGHAFSKTLKHPPEAWLVPYRKLAQECGITLDMRAAFDRLQAFVNQLPRGGAAGAQRG